MASSEYKGMAVSEVVMLNELGFGRLSKLHYPVNIWTAKQPITYTVKRFKQTGFCCTKLNLQI